MQSFTIGSICVTMFNVHHSVCWSWCCGYLRYRVMRFTVFAAKGNCAKLIIDHEA